MAKVNRFFQSPGVQQVRAIGLQEAMALPSYMRQRHDAIAGAAAKISVLDSPSMGQDTQAVRQILDPIEKEVESLSNDLAKNGYDPQKAEQLMNVQAKYQKAKRDGLAQIEGRLKTVQAEKKKIEEFYAENPKYAKHFSGLLSMANQGKTTVDDEGNVKVPGVTTPEYSKILSQEEITDMTTKLFTAMEPTVQAMGFDIQNFNSLYDVVTDGSIEGIDATKIQKLFNATLNSMPELKNSFRTSKAVAGVGTSQYIDTANMTQEQIGNIVGNDVSTLKSTYDNQLQNTSLMIFDKLVKEKMRAKPKLSEEEAYQEVANSNAVADTKEFQAAQTAYQNNVANIQKAVDSGNYKAIGKAALDASTDFHMKNTLGGIADGLSYVKTKLNRKVQTKPEWYVNPDNGSGDEALDFQTVNLEYANNEIPFALSTDGVSVDQTGEIVGSGQETLNTIQANIQSAREKGYNTDDLEEKYKTALKTKGKADNLKTLKDEVGYFRNMDNNQFLNYIKNYKDATKSIVTSGVVVPNDEGTKFRKLYLGSRDSNNNIKSPDLANQSTYSLNNGEADQTLHNIADKLGYDNIEELIQTGGFSQAVFVPNIGKWVATALDQENEGKPTNIFISPTNELAQETSTLKEVTQGIMSAAPITKLKINSAKTGTNAYLVNDYKSNKPYIVYTDEKIDINSENAYDELMGEMSKIMGQSAYLGKKTLGNEDMAIMEARDFLSVGGTKVVNNNNFKSILSL